MLGNENEDVFILEELLEQLRHFSSHQKIEFLARSRRSGAEIVPKGEAGLLFIIPHCFYDDASGLLQEIAVVIRRFDQQLRDAEGVNTIEPRYRRKLDFGQIFLERDEFPIVRGSLRLVQCRPVISNISEITVRFLQSIDKRHVVIRENHGGWGYHFHYCNAKKKRSDTVLSFRDKLNKHGDKVIFHEVHAEGKSAFHARVDLWGRKKKESAYSACLSGVGRFTLADFKKPGASAETLWPEA